jgi:hypothetical protein
LTAADKLPGAAIKESAATNLRNRETMAITEPPL